MRVARRIGLVLALVGLLWGAAQLVIPVKVTVGSALPGVVDDLLPGAASNQRVDCGPALAPRTLDGGDGLFDALSDLAGSVLLQDCDRAISKARRQATLWIAFSTALGLASLILLRDPVGARRRAGSSTGEHTTPSQAHITTTPPTPLLAPPTLEERSARQDAHVEPPEQEPGSSPSRRPVVIGGVALAVGALVAVWAVRSNDDDAFDDVDDPSFSEVTQADPRAVECVRNAMSESDRLYEVAQAASARDRDEAILNLDGDGSFVDYAAALALVDLFRCPADFTSGFDTWTAAWGVYGHDLQDGGADFGRYVDLIQAADEVLHQTAENAGINLPPRTWNAVQSD